MLTIVGLYLAALPAIGWWCQRNRIAGMTEFLLAGRRLGVVLCRHSIRVGLRLTLAGVGWESRRG